MKRLLLFCAGLCLSMVMRAQTTTVASDSADLRIFEKVDIEAEYPGGLTAWRRYLEKNLKADVPTNRGAPIGKYTVVVQFMVDKSGNVSDVTALTNNGYGTEDEVIRVLNNSGTWLPASQNGRPVKAFRKQPVTFVVVDDDIEVITQVPYQLTLNKDNRVTISVNKLPAENIEVSVPDGVLVRNTDDSYTIHPVKKGRLLVIITNTKKHKEVGRVSFEVVAPK